MSRVKGGPSIRRRHKKILKLAKGYQGALSRRYRTAKEAVQKAERYAYVHRREKKRDFRKLWITRINAFVRNNGITYSQFMGALKKANIEIDRKNLSNMAINDKQAFLNLLEIVKKEITK